MLRRSFRRAGAAGLDVEGLYPYGVPRRTFPYREHNKQICLAPTPGGFYLTKHAVGWPFHAPFEFLFYKVPCIAFIGAVMYDLVFGFPLPFEKEQIPGKPTHHFFNNNGGRPHHFWAYQDGWFVPNESGAKRWVE